MKITLSKTMVYFVIVSILIFSVTAVLLFHQYSNAAQMQEESNTAETLELTATRLHTQVTAITDDMRTLAAEPVFMEFNSMTPSQRYQVKDYIQTILNSFSGFHADVISMKLHAEGRSGVFSENNSSTLTNTSLVVAYQQIVEQYQLDTLLNGTIITQPYAYENRYIFGIAVPVYSSWVVLNEDTYQGCLIVVCDFAAFADVMPLPSTPCCIVSGETVLLSNNDDLATMISANETDAQIITRDIPILNLQTVALTSGGKVTEQMQVLGRYSVTMVVVLFIVQGLLMIMMHLKITRPIENIARQTKQIGKGVLRIENPDTSRNELDVLTTGINDMVGRVKQLSREAASAENMYLRERVMFLQTQINPHFLFNNLECIRGMASVDHTDSIVQITSCMANLYRYCVHNTGAVTLADELDCLQQYMEIMNLRYHNGFSLTTDIASDTLEMLMPSMVLQPLAENAIQHGFLHGGRKSGQIHVVSYESGGNLYIELIDNGVGMEAGQIADINAKQQAVDPLRPHIGIINIQSRIAIVCKKGSHLRYESRKHGFLTASVCITGMLENQELATDIFQ